ncbi:MAG: hypothetical protein V2A67_07185 [Bacteroidota bacterium]
MKEKDTYSPGPDHPSHLDENEVALFAEFLRHERENVPAALREHVETCARCRAEVMAVADMLEEVGKRETEDERLKTRDQGLRGQETRKLETNLRRLTPIIRVVASLAAVILLAWIIQLIRPEKPDPGIIAGSDSVNSAIPVIAPADTLRLAQAFVPDGTLENLVNATYRAANDPKPQGPSNETVFHAGDTLRINWIPQTGGDCFLVILNNRGSQQAKMPTGKSGSLLWKINLEPGLYYWKFLGKEELWKVGKFKVLVTTH